MNAPIRLTLGLTLAAITAHAAAQTGPKSEMALVLCDNAPGESYGKVHRVNVNTGLYLGSFGGARINHPSALAVQPSTGTVYVADATKVTCFDPTTGQALRTYASNAQLGGTAMALRFSPEGDLMAVVRPAPTTKGYCVVRMDPTKSTILAKSALVGTDYKMHVSIGFRPGGMVEVFNSLNDRSYADLFTPNLQSATHPFTNGADLGACRTTNDEFVWCEMITSFDAMFNGGVGAFGVGKTFAVEFATPYALFAEGANLRTFCFVTMRGVDRMMRMDTKLRPVSMLDAPMEAFKHGKPLDMAIYSQY